MDRMDMRRGRLLGLLFEEVAVIIFHFITPGLRFYYAYTKRRLYFSSSLSSDGLSVFSPSTVWWVAGSIGLVVGGAFG